jgi:2-polyprenyl-6-methoxyphenol hydroxylase-like FAD-dependent oxidoreductase
VDRFGGDAIHSMSPSRGEGANTALRDAHLLRDVLVEAVSGGVALADVTARYEAEMPRYGFEAVANSVERPFVPNRTR